MANKRLFEFVEHLIADNTKEAEKLFHEYIVETSANYRRSLLEMDDITDTIDVCIQFSLHADVGSDGILDNGDVDEDWAVETMREIERRGITFYTDKGVKLRTYGLEQISGDIGSDGSTLYLDADYICWVSVPKTMADTNDAAIAIVMNPNAVIEFNDRYNYMTISNIEYYDIQ